MKTVHEPYTTREEFTSNRIAVYSYKGVGTQTIYRDTKTPALGLRVTKNEVKSYIFQSDCLGKTIRITIGNVKNWRLSDARKEARRLKTLTDQGIDPRAVRQQQKLERAENDRRATLDLITLGQAWQVYIEARRPHWSERHYRDHLNMVIQGKELERLADVRLIDITPSRLITWAKTEAAIRPTRARLALRLLRAFLFWCMEHDTYGQIVTSNAAQNKSAKEILGKPKVKSDVLQREQLTVWFKAVRQLNNPVISAYLQALILTGARREEMANIRWYDVDFQWNSLTIKDKVEGQRIIPLTPYLASLLDNLPRRNGWVFSSPTSSTGRLAEPRIAHNKALTIAGLPPLTLHGLRRSFATLSEWTGTPYVIAAQIQGHKPQGVREQHYIKRPLDLLRKWHIQIEAWMLEEAGVDYSPARSGLHIIQG